MNSNDKNLNDIQDIEGFVKKLESNPDLIDNLSKERIARTTKTKYSSGDRNTYFN